MLFYAQAMSGERTEGGRFALSYQSWLAIGLIWLVWGHFTERVPAPYLGVPEEPALICNLGKFGIFIGFVVFGYLFTQARERSKDLAELYSDGLARIWPLLVAASLLIYVIVQFFPAPVVPSGPKEFNTEPVHLGDLLGSLLFLEDLGFAWVDGAFWPLLTVVKFWVLAGLLAFLAPRRHVQILTIAAIVVSLAAMILEFVPMPGSGLLRKALNGLLIASYLPYFVAGVLIGHRRRTLSLLAITVVVLLHVALTISHIYQFDWLATAIVLVLTAALVGVDRVLARGAILGFVARFAFAWFLVHQIIGLILIKWLAPQIGIDPAVAFAFAATLAIGVGLSLTVEGPGFRLLKRPLERLFRAVGLARLRLAEAPRTAAA